MQPVCALCRSTTNAYWHTFSQDPSKTLCLSCDTKTRKEAPRRRVTERRWVQKNWRTQVLVYRLDCGHVDYPKSKDSRSMRCMRCAYDDVYADISRGKVLAGEL